MTNPEPPQLDTPAMRQYRSFKEQYPDYILLFRMGDFYELFYEDAQVASRVLGLALTSRSKGPTAIPLAGLPYHALDSYLARLLKAGHRVAICEQVEDPKLAKGVVKRDVVRLVTPGTLTDESLLDQREGNYLAAVFPGGGRCDNGDEQAGLAWVELSSGTFWAADVPAGAILDELVRIGPAEVLVPEGSAMDDPQWRASCRQAIGASCAGRPAWAFEAREAGRLLQEQFATSTLEGFGFANWSPAVSAAGAVIEYLRETQKAALDHIGSLRRFDRADHMLIDGNTLRCLEVHRTLRSQQRPGSLLHCIDRTCTGMGARLLERWLTFPLVRYSQILARQDAIAELLADRTALDALRTLLDRVTNIDRAAANISLGRVRPRELVALGQTLALLPDVRSLLSSRSSELLAGLAPAMDDLDGPGELIARTIHPDCPNVVRDGGVIASGCDEQLDHLRRISSDGQDWLAEYQASLSRRLELPNLKVGYNKVFGYYIEVSHANQSKVPADFVRKQTIKNAERYITDDLKRYESEVLTAAQRARDLEARLFEALRVELCQWVPRLQQAAEALATLDVLAALAQVALERGYVRPTITQENVLEIVGGRHPVLAEQLREQFVPNDLTMGDKDDRMLIITGPNMAGKSTYIRQVALLTLLAQTGSFLPVQQATIGIADRIFTRVGASDELARGLSTFMVEMVETANILNTATSRSLVILDEVGRGTSTSDGLALAWAISEHIALRLRCRTLFATHYHELTELEQVLDGTSNLNVAVREWAGEVIFLHKIVEGGADKSYGVHVARLAGIPRDVIARAREILPQLEAHLAKGLKMPQLAQRARQARQQLDLFADAPSRVARDLKNLDLDNLTPLQALQILRRLQAELE